MPVRQTGQKYTIPAVILLILMVTFIAFCPTLGNGFINLDDPAQVTDNWMIQNPSPEIVARYFTTPFLCLYQPLVLLSHALEYHFFRLDPRAYHTTNLVLHLSNCLLVFWMVLILSRSIPVSLSTALLFGVHPFRVQSVAWVTERKDLLFSFFFLLSLICYIYFRQRKALSFYFLSLGFCFMSLMSKPMAVTLPFIMLLYDYGYHRELRTRELLEKIPFFAASTVISLLTIGHNTSIALTPAVLAHNLPIAASTLLFYLCNCVIPFRLSFCHVYPPDLYVHIPPVFYLYVVVAALLLFMFMKRAKYSTTLLFGGFFFLITIFPVLQLIPIANYELVAERYTYIPSIGLIFLVCSALFHLYHKRGRTARVLIVGILITLTSAFSMITFKRCGFWKDSLTFWNEMLAGDSANPYAYINRGDCYAQAGEYDLALADYNRAVSLYPGCADTYVQRGALLVKTGNGEAAIVDFDRALALDPNNKEAYNNRGMCYKKAGLYDRALADYDSALSLDPGEFHLYNNRGNLYMEKGDYDAALSDFQKALSINPLYENAYTNRGNVYLRKGDPVRAIEDYTSALRLNPENSRAYNCRAHAYLMSGEYDKARGDMETLQNLGLPVDPALIELLRAASEGEK